ncbi:uncharacterized protein LOC110982574 isoform X2 [Acanthaster planci]|uniref:Uncharacterized protein LOC110982574 isoform X2 n=1 Tax=Acanthaster planci TaxID=133434 RepID=A0A8B7YU01_ACAPL|nr:uncharacterized protein LOC110982574 isoform X2 [Acanthaster planci]
MGGKSSKTDVDAVGGYSVEDREDPLVAHQGDEIPGEFHRKRGQKFTSLTVTSNLTTSHSSLRPGSAASSVVGSYKEPILTSVRFEDFEYPFENVVFEGGGNKGLAYAGAVRVFENAGLWPNIRRLAGASAGAMWAILLGVGYSSHDVEGFLSLDLKEFFLDASCGVCSLVPNVMKHYGWHPASKLYSWFGDRLEDATGCRDITFQQTYDRFNKEICIVVTNVNVMDAEYCHVKTTPNMSIRMAMRMSMAIPGLFCAVKYKRFGVEDCYVDGGLLCNYPIHCFDGWWLSMKPEDSFLQRLQPLENAAILMQKSARFAPVNEKTIGFLLYSSDEQDLMVNQLALKNARCTPVDRPNTKLSRNRKDAKIRQCEAAREHQIVTEALSKFLAVLSDSQLDRNIASISRKELEAVFAEISFNELMGLAEQKGLGLQSYFLGYQRQDITSFRRFLDTLSNTLLVNVKRVFTTDGDLERTVGIDTLYVSATDFQLEEGDRQFLVKQGQRAAATFLNQWTARNPDKAIRKQSSPAPAPIDLPTTHRRKSPSQVASLSEEQESKATAAAGTPLAVLPVSPTNTGS